MDEGDDLTDSTAARTVEPQRDQPTDALPNGLREAVRSVDELEHSALIEHIELYQQIHTGLQDALSGIEGV